MPRCLQYQSANFATSAALMAGWSIPVNSIGVVTENRRVILFRLVAVGRGDRFGTGGVLQHLVANTVRHGLLGVEKAITLAVLAHSLKCLAGALGHYVNQGVLGLENFLSLDFDIGGLSINAAEGLVNHHLGVGGNEAFSLSPAYKNTRPAAFGSADAVSRNVACQKPHDIVDGQRVVDN